MYEKPEGKRARNNVALRGLQNGEVQFNDESKDELYHWIFSNFQRRSAIDKN